MVICFYKEELNYVAKLHIRTIKLSFPLDPHVIVIDITLRGTNFKKQINLHIPNIIEYVIYKYKLIQRIIHFLEIGEIFLFLFEGSLRPLHLAFWLYETCTINERVRQSFVGLL